MVVQDDVSGWGKMLAIPHHHLVQTFKILMKYNSSFFFYPYTSGAVSRKALPNPEFMRMYLMFSSKFYKFRSFIDRSMIDFELIFMYSGVLQADIQLF